MVEVTLRTVQGRFLLRPSTRLNAVVIGVIGRAQRKYGMKIHALVVLSNHAHLALSPESPQQLAAFMGFVAGNIAREVGRLHGWREKFWSRRYRAIVVSPEEEAQIERLAYVLANAVKEGLVEQPHHWPGVHCSRALVTGSVIEGTWFDRTAEYEARRRGEVTGSRQFAEQEQVQFSPIPCWSGLAPAAYRRRVAELIATAAAGAKRQRGTPTVLGKRAILAQHPHAAPLHCDRSPAPLFHAASKAIRTMLRTAYYEFVAAFRQAALRLRRGDRLVRFPAGAFPPPIPCLTPS